MSTNAYNAPSALAAAKAAAVSDYYAKTLGPARDLCRSGVMTDAAFQAFQSEHDRLRAIFDASDGKKG